MNQYVALSLAILIGVLLGGAWGFVKIKQIQACNNGQMAACIQVYKH